MHTLSHHFTFFVEVLKNAWMILKNILRIRSKRRKPGIYNKFFCYTTSIQNQIRFTEKEKGHCECFQYSIVLLRFSILNFTCQKNMNT